MAHSLRAVSPGSRHDAETLDLLSRNHSETHLWETKGNKLGHSRRSMLRDSELYQVAVWLTHGAGSLAGIGMIHGGDHPSGGRHGCCRPAPL